MKDTNREIVKKLKDKMMRRQLLRLAWKTALAVLFLLLLYVWAGYYFGLVVWQGTEPLYPLLKFIEEHALILAVLTVMAGLVTALVSAWRKTFDYLYEVIDAIGRVYDSSPETVTLSEDLAEVENQLNYMKLDIQKKENAAREAEQRKNDLVVYLAHDLKTPLTSVIGYLTLLRDERQISEELQEKYLAISLEKAERLEDLINDFFEIARFNLTALTLDKGSVSLDRMLEQIIFEFQPMLKEKGLTCHLETEKGLMLDCDADKMQRVFDNLLRNAVNYSYPDTEITVMAKRQEAGVCIRVANHGKIIPEEKLNRIFEQFFRLDSSRGSRNGGAGLGLAIAREIVELHGGTIKAGSENEIIWFEIQLPAPA